MDKKDILESCKNIKNNFDKCLKDPIEFRNIINENKKNIITFMDKQKNLYINNKKNNIFIKSKKNN